MLFNTRLRQANQRWRHESGLLSLTYNDSPHKKELGRRILAAHCLALYCCHKR